MRKLAISFALLGLGVLLFFLWMVRLPPFDGHSEPVATPLSELRFDQDAVRVEGTAHYALKVSYDVPAKWGRQAHTRWLFPLFERQDTMGRSVTTMISSPVAPENLVSFEDMVVEGEARKPQIAMTASVETAFKELGYTFAEDYVLVVVYREEAPSP